MWDIGKGCTSNWNISKYHEHDQVLAQGPNNGGVRNQYDNEVIALVVSKFLMNYVLFSFSYFFDLIGDLLFVFDLLAPALTASDGALERIIKLIFVNHNRFFGLGFLHGKQ